jgi:hypothetical protein
MESSSSEEHSSASEDVLSNERKQKNLQDLQLEKSKATLEECDAKGGMGEAPARPPRNLRVNSLEESSPSFTAEKDVVDMAYCVNHQSVIRSLVGKNDQLSKFSDYWASDHKSTMPMKAVFTPAKLMHGKIEVLSRFYNPLHPPYFRISRELMGRVIHTMRHEYISDDENLRMSGEFKEHVKDVLAPLEATLANAATRLSEHQKSSMEQHEKLIKDA